MPKLAMKPSGINESPCVMVLVFPNCHDGLPVPSLIDPHSRVSATNYSRLVCGAGGHRPSKISAAFRRKNRLKSCINTYLSWCWLYVQQRLILFVISIGASPFHTLPLGLHNIKNLPVSVSRDRSNVSGFFPRVPRIAAFRQLS